MKNNLKSLETAIELMPEQVFSISRASDKYLAYVNKIGDDKIKNFTLQALGNTAYQFWVCPSSSSGKHHPQEDNGTAGLVRHLIKAAEISIELCRFYDAKAMHGNWEQAEDIALAATLLHDICKNGMPDEWKEHTDYTHGLLAYNFLDRFELKDLILPVKEYIKDAVRYHMGRWCKISNDDTEEAKKLNSEEIYRATALTSRRIFDKIVQLSDYLASRENISFMPGIDITKHPDYERAY